MDAPTTFSFKDLLSSLPKEDFPRKPRLSMEDQRKVEETLREKGTTAAEDLVKQLYSSEAYNLKRLIDRLFPKTSHKLCPKFFDATNKKVGKLLKKGLASEAEQCLLKEFAVTAGTPFDFKPPAKASVVAVSRPFEEWTVVKVTEAIQQYVFQATKEEVEKWQESVNEPAAKGGGGAFIKRWFNETGVNHYGWIEGQVQALNHIFKSTFARYLGVEEKVRNKNAKLKERAEKEGKEVVCLEAYHSDGKLKQPPGVSSVIFCVQQFDAKTPLKDKLDSLEKAIQVLPEDAKLREAFDSLSQFTSVDPQEPLPTYGHNYRISIPEGKPGHIPLHDRDTLNPKKRMRSRGKSRNRKPGHPKYVSPENRPHKSLGIRGQPKTSSLDDALLIVVSCEKDWALVDVRGLLRNARYRKLLGLQASLGDLLDLYTGDPTIDTGRRWVKETKESPYKLKVYPKGESGLGGVTYAYKEGKVEIVSKTPVNGKRTKDTLSRLTDGRSVALVGVDLGQTHPVAASVYTVSQTAGDLSSTLADRFFLPDDLLKDLQSYRTGYDALLEWFKIKARESLDITHQEALTDFDLLTPEVVKKKVCEALGLEGPLPWSLMSSRTTYISDKLLEAGVDRRRVYRVGKKGNEYKATDIKWYYEFRKLPKEAREAWGAKEWELVRSSDAFRAKSKQKTELTRRSINYLVREAQKLTGLKDVTLAVEDLTLDNRFMSGSGKRLVGWDNFFKVKKENRWFIQALHKSLVEQAPHHGIPVMLVNPVYTSQTCPMCLHCSRDSRDLKDRTIFVCVACNYKGHSDLDVASHNIAQVALLGKRLPGPVRERSDG